MKKYITLAALLAAGTACANAVELSDGIELASYIKQTDDGTFSVAIKFDVDALKSYLEKDASAVKHTLVEYSAAGTPTGITTNFSSAGGKIHTSGLYYLWGTNYAWGNPTNTDSTLTGTGNGFAAENYWDSVTAAGLVYTFSSTGGTQCGFALLGEDDAVIYQSYNIAGGLKASGASAAALTLDEAALGAVYFSDALGADDVKSLSVAVATASLVALPEPSAFGMLAGLGALALVASRRRRK